MNVRISSKDEQALAQENAALRNEVNNLKEQLALLQEQFDWLSKQVFGRKTEQTSVIMDGGTQLSLFSDEKEQAVSVPEKTVTVPEHQRKARRTHEDWMSNLPIKEERHEEEHPVCDAYNAVKGAKRCGCWTHTRRHFAEAMPKDQSAYNTSVAAKAVEFCNKIYHEEHLLADLTATERYEQRLVKVKPLLDAFFAWLDEQNVSGKGKLAKAVNYARNEKKYANSEKEPKIVTVGKLYGLSKNSIARLLRINTLTDDLKRSVDIDILSVRAAVELSYISKAAQEAVFNHFKESYVRDNIWVDAVPINEKKAKKLRALYADFDGNEEEAIEKVTAEESTSEINSEETKKEPKPMKIPFSVYGKFFDEDESAENVNDIILKALTMYFGKAGKETA